MRYFGASCKNPVNLRSLFGRVLRFAILARAICWGEPLIFFCFWLVLLFWFLRGLVGPLAPLRRMAGDAQFGPQQRRDLHVLGPLWGLSGRSAATSSDFLFRLVPLAPNLCICVFLCAGCLKSGPPSKKEPSNLVNSRSDSGLCFFGEFGRF